MLRALIRWSIQNRFLVLMGTLLLTAWGVIGLAGLARPLSVAFVGRTLFPLGAMVGIALAIVALLAFFAAAFGLFRSLHSGFLPDEDQGVFFAAVRLPDGASLERTQRVVADIEKRILAIPGVREALVARRDRVVGVSPIIAGQCSV